jgi:hypothetical protein
VEPTEPGQNVRDAHEILEHREDVIWRYMNLWKFISMLESHSLHFSRLDQFNDRHEAAISAPAFETAVIESTEYMQAHEGRPVSDEDARERAALVEAATSKIKRESILVNCWHRNPNESGAMWAAYGNQGVAIRSTIGALYDCTKHYRPSVMIQWTYYVDHAVQDMDREEMFLFKHKLYAYEQEVRALILLPPGTVAPKLLPLEVDLKRLINGVYLAPLAAIWQIATIKSLLEKYNLPDIEVFPSVADTIPDYRRRHDEYLEKMRSTPVDEVIAEYRNERSMKREP